MTGAAILDGGHPSQGRAWTGAVRQAGGRARDAPILDGGGLLRDPARAGMMVPTSAKTLNDSRPSQGRARTRTTRQAWERAKAAPILDGRALTVPARAAALDSDGLRRGRAQAGMVRQVRAAARLDDRTSLRGHARTAEGAAWRC